MGTKIISWALLAGRECILLVHWYDWYDWYKWNIDIIHSVGELHIIMGTSIISGALLAGRECNLLVHWFDWYKRK